MLLRALSINLQIFKESCVMLEDYSAHSLQLSSMCRGSPTGWCGICIELCFVFPSVLIFLKSLHIFVKLNLSITTRVDLRFIGLLPVVDTNQKLEIGFLVGRGMHIVQAETTILVSESNNAP